MASRSDASIAATQYLFPYVSCGAWIKLERFGVAASRSHRAITRGAWVRRMGDSAGRQRSIVFHSEKSTKSATEVESVPR